MRQLKKSPLLYAYKNMPKSIVERVVSQRERKERAAFLSKFRAYENQIKSEANQQESKEAGSQESRGAKSAAYFGFPKRSKLKSISQQSR